MKKEIILKGNGFTLRLFKKSDYISMAKNANDKEIAKNTRNGFPSPYTEKDAKEWIANVLKSYKNSIPTSFIIDVDGKALGTIGGSTRKNKPFIMSFGYWLGRKYWRKGITTEATKLFVNYVFKNCKNIVRIEAGAFLWNLGSRKVLERNGFKLEGISRKAYLKNGKIIDNYVFSKLRNER